MGGCRCSYKNCTRATNNSAKDFHFFHYPVKDPLRCAEWIANAKKPQFISLPEEQLRNKVVCQLHFEMQYFTNANKNRLIHNAIPTLDAGSDGEPPDVGNNVQVLQRDSEGSVFTVETSQLVQSEDVASYIIENDNLVSARSTTVNLTGPVVIKGFVGPDGSDANRNQIQLYECTSYGSGACGITRINAIGTAEDLLADGVILGDDVYTNEPEDMSEEELNEMCEEESEDISRGMSDIKEEDLSNFLPTNIRMIKTCTIHPTSQMDLDTRNNDTDHEMLKVRDISKTLEKHTREIALIRHTLNARVRNSKPKRRFTKIRVLNYLQRLLPPTLLGAVSLQLLPKHINFTKREKQFLMALYKASPAVYEILQKQYKWKLPDISLVASGYI